MKPRLKPPAPRSIERGGWSGGPVRDNPGERRFAVGVFIVATLLVGGTCIWMWYSPR